ncbi:MAG: MerR family transcriptional regulator [Pseudomonadota bacterium]
MTTPTHELNASEAAARLGISRKALRLYEQHGWITPTRTEAGWRRYGAADMARAAEIVALRALGLSLVDVGHVLQGDVRSVRDTLLAHEHELTGRIHHLTRTIADVRRFRECLDSMEPDLTDALSCLSQPQPSPSTSNPVVSFPLPWPWGGEPFELFDIHALNFITGPLGSGKTRLAQHLAKCLPDAGFLGLERVSDGREAVHQQLHRDSRLQSRVEAALSQLIANGAEVTDALMALLVGTEAESPACLVVDLIEHKLSERTQAALIVHLRQRGRDARPLFVMTRSSAILDLESLRRDETLIYCPANHSRPVCVRPEYGAPGYEAVTMCLASPDVRARTEGVRAVRE